MVPPSHLWHCWGISTISRERLAIHAYPTPAKRGPNVMNVHLPERHLAFQSSPNMIGTSVHCRTSIPTPVMVFQLLLLVIALSITTFKLINLPLLAISTGHDWSTVHYIKHQSRLGISADPAATSARPQSVVSRRTRRAKTLRAPWGAHGGVKQQLLKDCWAMIATEWYPQVS